MVHLWKMTGGIIPLRSIFIKIYLWFWLTIALVIAAQIAIDLITDSGPQPDPFKRFISDNISFYASVALEHCRNNDIRAIDRISRELFRTTGIQAYLIDGKDREIMNKSLSREVLDITALTRRSGKAQTIFLKDRLLYTLPVHMDDSKSFIIAGELRKHFKGPSHWSPSLILLRIIMVLMISAGGYYLLSRYLTSPIMQLREASRRFSEGDLTFRTGGFKSRTRDELTELAEDFDHMAERIESLIILQKQLLSDVSHELRSPLARLKVALEIARCQAHRDSGKILDRIEREADLLNDMVSQILIIARFESGIGLLASDTVDLCELVSGIAADADFEAGAAHRSVVMTQCEQCTVWGSREILFRAVDDVVRNAVRYTREHSSVEIGLKKVTLGHKTYAEIMVRDHGHGIPEKELKNIFRPFFRISGARDRKSGGAGLGLAITERAVSLHRGSVSAMNALDGGLVVVLLLPMESRPQNDHVLLERSHE